MCWKWGESLRDRQEVLAPRCPSRCSPPSGAGKLGDQRGGHWAGDARLPPTPWRGPWQGASSRSMRCDWVEESRAPRPMHRAGAAADVPREWRRPYTCLCLYNPPGISKFTETKWNQPGVKKENQPNSIWVNSTPKTTCLFPSIILKPLALQFGLSSPNSFKLPG